MVKKMVKKGDEVTLEAVEEFFKKWARGRKRKSALKGKVQPIIPIIEAEIEDDRISVDYSRTLEEMISSGDFHQVDQRINLTNFPVKQGEKKELTPELVHFDNIVHSKDITLKCKENNLRHGTLEELLAFREKYRRNPREIVLVALGSSCVIKGKRYVPVLWVGAQGLARTVSKLALIENSGFWSETCRFLTFDENVSLPS